MKSFLLMIVGVLCLTSLTSVAWGQTHPLTTVGATMDLTNLGAFSGNYVVVESRDSYAPSPYNPDPDNYVDWAEGLHLQTEKW